MYIPHRVREVTVTRTQEEDSAPSFIKEMIKKKHAPSEIMSYMSMQDFLRTREKC